MKGVSVTSAALTLVGMPMVALAETSVPAIGQVAMCGTVMLFSLGTTSLFHLLFRPYVSKMWQDPNVSERVTMETFTLLAQKKQTSVDLSSIEPRGNTMHPMVSFRAANRSYFIHPECITDEKLLQALTPTSVVVKPDV